MQVAVTGLADQLGVTTDKLLVACRSLGFAVTDATDVVDLDAFNAAIARKKAELAAAPAVENEPYFTLPSAQTLVAEARATVNSRVGVRERASRRPGRRLRNRV